MYDDDSDNGDDAKVGRKVADRVKRVARGTRRMSLMAADNVKKVAKGVEGNVKKNLHELDGQHKKKKKKKKKKKDKEKKEGKKKNIKKGIKKGIKKIKRRGRSESPRRSTNAAEESKPPVTKSGPSWKSQIAKRWRSVSPSVGRRGKKSKADTVDSEELEPLAPLPTFQSYGAAPDGSHDGMNSGGYGGQMSVGGGSAPYANHARNGDAVGESLRSLSSNARYERNQQQEKIERDNAVPVVSVLLRSKHFVKYCDIAFDLVDSNGDDVVDETELYAGLLLIHLKLGSFLGPAGCKPLGRARCSQMFRRFDTTGAGALDRGEFRRVMMVLFGATFARVFVQYTLTILIVPLVAKRVLDFLTWDSQRFWDYWTKPKALRRMGQEFTLKYFVDWDITSYPSSKRTFFTKLYAFFRLGSDEFWNTFPLTFMTIILGLVIAPFVLYYFDDAFQYALDYKEKREKMPPAKKR